MKMGFIGLGIMGSRMAANLQKHGHPLVVFNRTPAKAKPLLGACGTVADSPANLASDSNSASRFALPATDFPFGTEQN
jgi:3-hydroxyisobutyrate dehydrogenase-like beta-hydroxyacid dehydrogenase